MTQAQPYFDIQQVPSLPVYWYDPTTELVFSDGFTTPVLQVPSADTGLRAGNYHRTTTGTPGNSKESGSDEPGEVQEDGIGTAVWD